MADESLFTASRRVVQYFNIDMNKGGLITEMTQQAVETLAIQVEKFRAEEKARQKESEKGGDKDGKQA